MTRTLYLHSEMEHGVKIDWFDVGGEVYGLNSMRGITDKYANPVENIPANIAFSIMSAKMQIEA